MDTPLSILSIQTGILGHQTYANQMRAYFDASSSVNMKSYWMDEDREWSGRLVRRILNGVLPGLWIGERNLDFRRIRREVGDAYLAKKLVERQLKKMNYDLLYFHTQVPSLLAIHSMNRIPSVVSGDMTAVQVADENPDPLCRFTYKPNIELEKKVFAAARIIVLWSQWAASSVTKDYGVDPRKVRVVHPGVDLDAFPPIDREPNPSQPVRLLFVGNDFTRKGGHDLLNIFLKSDMKDVELHLVTSANVACNHSHVHIHHGIQAYSQEWRNIYQQADIFVLPTYREAFGLVLAEAMAASLPVVSTRISAIPEIVSDGKTGFLTTPGDNLSLASTLRMLIDNPEKRILMGRLGRQVVEAKFDAKKNFAKLESIFKEAIE